jgi:zinc transport system substrate-binding protein
MKMIFNKELFLMKRMNLLAAVLLACVLVLSACGPQPAQTNTDGKLVLTVSILPQKYFVERIGGEHVAVNVMVAPGDSPHSYEPKPEQMTALSNSAAYFSIGVDFEDAWLDKIAAANDDMLMVDLIGNIERRPMDSLGHDEDAEKHTDGEGEGHDEDEEGHNEEHADEHEDEEGNLDPHIWTSPALVKVMSQTIYETLAELDPEHADEYKANLDGFITDIETLEGDISGALDGAEGEKFFVYHPSWGYFARDFGLEQVPIEVGGTEPSASELAALIDEAKHEGAKIIFVQPEFSTRSAETIADEIGGSVILISPLDEDWLNNMRKVAVAFSSVLSQ